MELSIEGQQVQLRGGSSLCKTQISLHAMHRTLLHKKQGILLECRQIRAGSIEPPPVENTPLSTEVSNLLNDYQDLLIFLLVYHLFEIKIMP